MVFNVALSFGKQLGVDHCYRQLVGHYLQNAHIIFGKGVCNFGLDVQNANHFVACFEGNAHF